MLPRKFSNVGLKGGLGEIRVVVTESLLSVLDPKSPSPSRDMGL